MDRQDHSEYKRHMEWARHYEKLAAEAKQGAQKALAEAYGIELGRTIAVVIDEINGKEFHSKLRVDSIEAPRGDLPPKLSGAKIRGDGSAEWYDITTSEFSGRWEITGETAEDAPLRWSPANRYAWCGRGSGQ